MKKHNNLFLFLPLIFILITYLMIFILEMFYHGMFFLDLCLEKACIERVVSISKNSWSNLKSIVEVLAYTLTSFGIFYAAMSYRLSEKTSKTISHIENFKLFDQFLKTEVEKSQHLLLKSFNTGRIYKSIYPKSREGLFYVGDDFLMFIENLSKIIEESSKTSDLNYTNHQNKIIKTFDSIGISVTNLHRMDFWHIEKDLFNTIDSISSNFIYDDSLKITCEIKYR